MVTAFFKRQQKVAKRTSKIIIFTEKKNYAGNKIAHKNKMHEGLNEKKGNISI